MSATSLECPEQQNLLYMLNGGGTPTKQNMLEARHAHLTATVIHTRLTQNEGMKTPHLQAALSSIMTDCCPWTGTTCKALPHLASWSASIKVCDASATVLLHQCAFITQSKNAVHAIAFTGCCDYKSRCCCHASCTEHVAHLNRTLAANPTSSAHRLLNTASTASVQRTQ